MLTEDFPSIRTVKTKSWEAWFLPLFGGQLLRLYHRPSKRDILHYPGCAKDYLEQPERFGVPVLFPPNRIAGGAFSCNGYQYSLPVNEPTRNNHLHGIVRSQSWEMSADEHIPEEPPAVLTVTLSYRHDENASTFSGYPHKFKLRADWLFHEDSIRQIITLENLDPVGSLPIPFGLGFHTSFRVSPPPDKPHQHLYLTTNDFHWELDQDRRLPTGEKLPWPHDVQFYRTKGQALPGHRNISYHCPCRTIQRNGKDFRGAVLSDNNDNFHVIYEVDENFRHWFIWAPPDDPTALCIEPMTCMANAVNLSMPSEDSGLRQLNSLDSWQCWTQLSCISSSTRRTVALDRHHPHPV